MSKRLGNLRIVDPVLTNMARGYSNAEFIGTRLFPFAPMAKEGGKIPTFGKDNFRVRDTERAIRAKSNRIMPEDRDTIDVVLQEHDLEYPIDYREAAESLFDEQQHGTGVTMEGIRLRHEKQCADLVQNPENYAATNKIVLTGADQFSDYGGSDPLVVISEAREAVRSRIVKYPNLMEIPADVWAQLKMHPKLLELVKYSQRGVLTVEMLQELFEVPEIVIGKAVHADPLDNFEDLWSKHIWLGYVEKGGPRGANYRDPSFGYTLHKRGYPQTDRYDELGGKVEIVRTTDFFEAKVLGPDAGFLIVDAI